MAAVLKPGIPYDVRAVGAQVEFRFGNMTVTVEPETAHRIAQRARTAAKRAVQYMGGSVREIRVLAQLTDAVADEREWQAARDGTGVYMPRQRRKAMLTDGNA